MGRMHLVLSFQSSSRDALAYQRIWSGLSVLPQNVSFEALSITRMQPCRRFSKLTATVVALDYGHIGATSLIRTDACQIRCFAALKAAANTALLTRRSSMSDRKTMVVERT